MSYIPVLPWKKIAFRVIKRKLETKLPYKFKGNDFRKFSWYIKKKSYLNIYAYTYDERHYSHVTKM